MFKINLYKYDSSQEANGYRGVGDDDFSRFVLQGQDWSEDITQVLDTAEITLAGLPFEQSFDPETKFILDLVEYGEAIQEQIVQTIHLVVARDTVDQPILSDKNYFDHHVSFIEPSVIAQKRLVDNSAVTYKLKDVSLEEQTATPDTTINMQLPSSSFSPASTFVANEDVGFFDSNWEFCVGKYFVLEGNLIVTNNKGERVVLNYNNIERFKNDDGTYSANFTLPKIGIMFGDNNSSNFSRIGSASIAYQIAEYSLNDEYNPTNIYSGSVISNDDLGYNNFLRLRLVNASSDQNWFNKLDGEWLYEYSTITYREGTSRGTAHFYYKKYTEKSAPTPNYTISNVPIKPDKRYIVTISLYQFPDNIPNYSEFGSGQYFYGRLNKSTETPCYYSRVKANFRNADNLSQRIEISQNLFLNNSQTSTSSFIVTYTGALKSIVYSSSTPYSALALLQKAIINSGLYEKKQGVYIADVNNSNLPFYIDPAFTDELSATVIIENFYNQKNLWEIMVEVGNYIHSIPELKFGNNDRFMITFNRLGITNESEDFSTPLSIFNSRSVEDYICATSSYITNMVQLGGYVEEWVVPKTTNETLLISNDTAEIVTSKPIIELLDIYVKANVSIPSMGITQNQVAPFTDFIYEENVYKTLSIDFNVEPNRGIALFYKLGTNVITGGDYQLPQVNTNIYTDYAIKKAIYCAYNGYRAISPAPTSGYWTDLRVNDFSFLIRYRTKDSVRQSHIRPDIRKYLLNTQWDRYPQHNQFNNQTDVVVDSIKFGNNMIGKLIKTGNNSYDIYEWNDNYRNVKHKGELYRINDELYYVAKITHTIYHSYILSKVSYSKDYNELSNIIGIPSEPRFYEISEQSLIWREFEINDILLLTDDDTQLEYKNNYVFNFDHLGDLILGEGTDFAKYAITVFKGDKDANNYDQTVGQSNLYIAVISPINAYSSENTLTYEYDMEDNYSAGNKVIDTPQFDPSGNKPNKGSYNSLLAVKYTDIYGRASLMDFYILGDIGTPNINQIKAFPESPIDTKDPTATNFIGNYNILATNVMEFNTDFNGRGIGLLKDCREAISNNYNLRMATNSDTFVISPYVYLPKKSNLKIVLLAEEVNKLSSGYIDNSKIITPFDKNGNQMNPYFDFDIEKITAPNNWDNTKQVVTRFGINLETIFADVADEHFADVAGFQRIKGIAILCDVSLDAGLDTENPVLPYKTQFVVARNIPSYWNRTQALKKWVWGSPKKDKVFKNKQ